MPFRFRWFIVVLVIAFLATAFMDVDSALGQRERRNSRATAPAVKSQPVNRFGLSEPLPRREGAIRVATYNVLNLFDEVDDPSLQGEFDDIKTPTSRERCQKMAEAIKAIDADVIGLAEVESLEAVTWCRVTFLPDAGY